MTDQAKATGPDGRFAELLVKYDRELARYIFSLVPNPVDTEDILQKTAIAIWEQFAEYDQTRDFLPWAKRFAYFEVLNYRKSRARDRLIFNEEAIAFLAEARVEHQTVLEQRRIALKKCLRKLGEADRELLEQRYGRGSSIADLAESRNRTVKSLYRRLDRVRELIADCIERNHRNPEALSG